MTDIHMESPPTLEALTPLIQSLARVAARTAYEVGIGFDMENPEVARSVTKATFEGLFLFKGNEAKRGDVSGNPTKSPNDS